MSGASSSPPGWPWFSSGFAPWSRPGETIRARDPNAGRPNERLDLTHLPGRMSMAYDTHLASRLRQALHRRPNVKEREQFGGIGFLVPGNMACGVIGKDLLVRV